MSDDLDGVAYVTSRGERMIPGETDLARMLAELEAGQKELEGLVGQMEAGLAGARERLGRNRAALVLLSKHLRGQQGQPLPAHLTGERN